MFNLVNRARAKKNKGFSLVELIVVVLIIAIIAVALAPQVMKYVAQSRTNVDLNNAASIKSSVQAAYTEYLGAGGTTSAAVTTNGTAAGGSTSVSGISDSTLATLIVENVGKFPNVKSSSTNTWNIAIGNNGSVTVSVSGAGISTN